MGFSQPHRIHHRSLVPWRRLPSAPVNVPIIRPQPPGSRRGFCGRACHRVNKRRGCLCRRPHARRRQAAMDAGWADSLSVNRLAAPSFARTRRHAAGDPATNGVVATDGESAGDQEAIVPKLTRQETIRRNRNRKHGISKPLKPKSCSFAQRIISARRSSRWGRSLSPSRPRCPLSCLRDRRAITSRAASLPARQT